MSRLPGAGPDSGSRTGEESAAWGGEWDVVVVGAGPAGSTAALSLARAGVRVMLLDRADFPRWKVCGGCLGPAALRLLDALGLTGALHGAGAVPLEILELRAGSRRAHVRLGGSLALSRAVLDDALASAVVEAGGTVGFGVRVEGVSSGPRGVALRLRDADGVGRMRATVVVDATGLAPLQVDGGRTAEAVSAGSRVGLGAVFPADSARRWAPGLLRMMVGQGGYVGAVVVEDGSLNVAAAVDRERVTADGPGEVVAAIAASAGSPLPDVEPLLGWRGTPALTRCPERAAAGRIFRVGDAAGYVEPFTGEGMGWAVSDGVGVAAHVREALAGGADEAAWRWSLRHADLVVRRQRVCRLLARGLRRARAVEAAVGLLRLAPQLARPLVAATSRVPAGVIAAAPAPRPGAPR